MLDGSQYWQQLARAPRTSSAVFTVVICVCVYMRYRMGWNMNELIRSTRHPLVSSHHETCASFVQHPTWCIKKLKMRDAKNQNFKKGNKPLGNGMTFNELVNLGDPGVVVQIFYLIHCIWRRSESKQTVRLIRKTKRNSNINSYLLERNPYSHS